MDAPLTWELPTDGGSDGLRQVAVRPALSERFSSFGSSSSAGPAQLPRHVRKSDRRPAGMGRSAIPINCRNECIDPLELYRGRRFDMNLQARNNSSAWGDANRRLFAGRVRTSSRPHLFELGSVGDQIVRPLRMNVRFTRQRCLFRPARPASRLAAGQARRHPECPRPTALAVGGCGIRHGCYHTPACVSRRKTTTTGWLPTTAPVPPARPACLSASPARRTRMRSSRSPRPDRETHHPEPPPALR